jgi:hypothetical protein
MPGDVLIWWYISTGKALADRVMPPTATDCMPDADD